MSIRITMPSDKEGQLAIAAAYWGSPIPTAVANKINSGNTSQLQRAVADMNDWFSRAEDKLTQNNPNYSKGHEATYADWSANMQKTLDQYEAAGISQYITADSSGQQQIREAGVSSSLVEKSDVEKMEAGEMQPNLNAFKEEYGSDALKKYQSALETWKTGGQGYESLPTADSTLVTVKDKNGNTSQVSKGSPLIESGYYTIVDEQGADSGTEDATATMDETGNQASGTSTADSTAAVQYATESALTILDNALSTGQISQDTYDMFSQAVLLWDPDQEANVENILSQFETMKKDTIDPYWAKQLEVATKSIQAAADYKDSIRALELNSEDLNAKAKLKSAQDTLEATGMTFTGEARRQLGSQSAYQQGTETAENRIPFGGEAIEGTVEAENRLISTSSKAAYEQSMNELGLSAEQVVGSDNVSGLGITGYTPVGGVTGSVESARKTDLGNVLTSLANQESINVAAREPITYEFSS